jgi:molecular chaperone DnaK (HSP70)
MKPTANAPKAKPESGVLFVGIDLGTSHTAIAASNGNRTSVDSGVGYPREVMSL